MRGVARHHAKEYPREGPKVVACARSQSPTGLSGILDETAAAIRAEGGEVLPIACDVTDEDQVGEMVRHAMDKYGQIDVLFNNAGAMVLGETLLEIDAARWQLVVDVNVTGTYMVSRAVVPLMIKPMRGSLIHLGSRIADDPQLRGRRRYRRTGCS